MKSPTIEDRLEGLVVDSRDVVAARRQGRETAKVLDGIKRRRAPNEEGEHYLSPEQLLNLTVPEVSMNGKLSGYQRAFDPKQARKAARAMLDGEPAAPIIVAIPGLEIVDGQHRAAAGVIARMPVWAIFKRMDKDTRRRLFNSQRYSKRVDGNTFVLGDDGLFAKYIREAIETNENPWSEIVSHNPKSKTRIGPYAMFQLLVRYIGNAEGQGTGSKVKSGLDEAWDRGLADELAPMIACFGDKQSNPLAFKPANLQAIGATAMWVFRRHDALAEDHERWLRHMPSFPFDRYPHIRTQRDMTQQLIRHWNKRLSEARQVRA